MATLLQLGRALAGQAPGVDRLIELLEPLEQRVSARGELSRRQRRLVTRLVEGIETQLG